MSYHAAQAWLDEGLSPVELGPEKVIEIPPGTGLDGIAALLKQEHLIPDELAYKIGVRWWRLASELKAGYYRISPEMSPKEIAELIASGEVATIKVTIPEGFTVDQIAERMAGNKLCTAEEFLAAAVPATVADTGLGSEEYQSLEGYLFPATYVFRYDETPEELVTDMVGAFRARVLVPMKDDLAANELPVDQVVTIASLIEREARVAKDRELISAVIHNRLRQGWRLDIDATVLYALGEHKDVLTREDLRVDSPFNTRRYKGLPPHPIASPGEASIRAALNPARVDYMFYVARPDGSHIFTRTNAEHERAKRAIREGQR